MKNLAKESKGFTIIEVLIVLAIAGLIMVIVFLAVPALNRNSRNTGFREEASQLLSAASEFASNNNGKLPAASTCSGGTCTASPPTNDAAKMYQLTKLRDITELDIVGFSGTATTYNPTFSKAILITGAKCGTQSGTGNNSVFNTVSGPGRALALVYAVEAADGTELSQCLES